MTTRRLGLVLAAVAWLVTSGRAAPGGQAVYKSGIDVVSFGVTVRDKRSNFVTDLTAEDFEIREEGQPQAITYFTRGDDQSPSEPLHIGLLFDTSGSMEADLKLSRSAAVKFLNTLTNAVDMTLVDFDTEVRVARFAQGDFPRLVERIRQRTAKGYTALYDALGVYLDGADDQVGRKILVIYTDGGDTTSSQTLHDTMTLLRASDVTVYSIGFMEHAPASFKLEAQRHLRQMAETTGGQAFFPTSMKDVDAAYEKVLAEMRAQYSLGYVSSNIERNGAWRKVEIKVKRQGLRDLALRMRKGYFAPYDEPPR